MLDRLMRKKLEDGLADASAVALLGPRQVGKTSLALEIAAGRPSVYLDLEAPEDLAKLQDASAYLAAQSGKLVVLDEIQRKPELFPVLRGLIDKARRSGRGNGQFLILGSASVDLLKQSSETLAGRIRYLELGGLTPLEIGAAGDAGSLWLRGGFPLSYLAGDDVRSVEWREDFIRTYLERDIPQLGPRVPAVTLRRFWTMLAHLHGGMVNASKLASGLDLSHTSVLRYLDLMVDLLLVRRLAPWHANAGKRLVKSPKVYLRDSGLLHRLLGVMDMDDLLGNPVVGASWEGHVIENLLAVAPGSTEAFFYRTSGGDEVDLLLRIPKCGLWAIEIKRSSAPQLEKGFHRSCDDLAVREKLVIYQ
jgi:predicted AAA+ superfamily ATPase